MTDVSLREALRRLDPINLDGGTDSLRDVMRQLRWVDVDPGELPSGDVSLRSELAPLLDPADQVAFLHLNTWLIRPDFQLKDLVTAAGGWAKFIVMIGMSPEYLLEKALSHIGSKGVCEKLFPPGPTLCGVSANPLYDACIIAGKTADVAVWLLAHVTGGIVALLDFLEVGLDLILDVVAIFLEESHTHLFELTGVAPQILPRAGEIGTMIAEYDVASLCEVWQPPSRGAILEHTAFAGGSSEGHLVDGPSASHLDSLKHEGSGPLLLTPRRPCSKIAEHVYEAEGVQRMVEGVDLGTLVDIDRWSDKGVVLSRVPAGNGFLEIYTTHLYSGGDGPGTWIPGLAKVSEQEKDDVRLAQVDELKAFIAAHHNPANVAIVAGDFNVDGTRPDQVEALRQRFTAIQLDSGSTTSFEDWFIAPGHVLSGSPFVEPDKTWPNLGGTHGSGGSNLGFAACTRYEGLKLAGHPNDFYCLDRSVEGANAGRIDYMFLEQPLASHTIRLVASRLRRRAFQRDQPDTDPDGDNHSNYLSDHLGLECTFFVADQPVLKP